MSDDAELLESIRKAVAAGKLRNATLTISPIRARLAERDASRSARAAVAVADGPPFKTGDVVTTDFFTGSRSASIEREVVSVELAQDGVWDVGTRGPGGALIVLGSKWYKCTRCGAAGRCTCAEVSPQTIT